MRTDRKAKAAELSQSQHTSGLPGGLTKTQRQRLGRCIQIEALEPRRFLSATFTVNSAGDDPLGPTSGVVTLRDAIYAVNHDASDSSSSPDVINFNIAGTPSIALAADLPALANPVLIDGSTQAGVTVDGQASTGANAGQGFAVLVDNSVAAVKDVTFTDGTLTVNAGGKLSVVGDLNLGDAGGDTTLVQNYGGISVSGNVVARNSTGEINYSGATFQVDGAFTAGQESYVYNYDAANLNVTGSLTLGDFGFLYNGQTGSDQATCTIGGSFNIGLDGFVYNYGLSNLSVTGDFSLGDGGFMYNGADYSSSDDAVFAVGGSLSIGVGGYVGNDGTSSITVADNFILGDSGYLNNGESGTDASTLKVGGNMSVGAGMYNMGHSVLTVGGDLTLGDGGSVYNGNSSTDAATLTVGGNFSSGVSGGSASSVYNAGASVFHVTGSLTLNGADSLVYNGQAGSDSAVLTVGGNVSLDTNSSLFDYGTSALTVVGSFTMGAGSYFVDDGTMSVSGAFDPGSASTSSDDIVAGTFNAEAGSTVTTDAAQWDVLAGGKLNVVPGATFDVAAGGALMVSGAVIDQGSLAVAGTLASSKLSTVVVDGSSQLSLQGSGQLAIQGTLLQWANPSSIVKGTALGSQQLDATATTMVGGVFVTLAGTFIYTLADDTTVAGGSVLAVGQGQILNVTFIPSDTTDYAGASAQVSLNVLPGKAAPIVTVNPVNITYGTTLKNKQLTGTASVTVGNQTVVVAGTYSFTSAVGTLLNAGNGQVEMVTFTPTDTTDYAAATVTVIVNVAKANQTIKVTQVAHGSAVDGSSFSVAATSSSGLPVSIAVSGAGVLTSGGSGSATVQMTSGTGTASLTFSQSGNGNYNPATVVTETVKASPDKTSTQVTSSANPAVYGQMVTFTAAVSNISGTGLMPTGTVQFTVNGVDLGAPVAVDATGHATSPATSFLSGASHNVRAVYTAGPNFVGGSGSLIQVVESIGVEPDPANPALMDLFVVSSSTSSSNDNIKIDASGASNSGTTGVLVTADVNGVQTQATYSEAFHAIYILGGRGNDTIQMAGSLAVSAFVTEGNGNDTVNLGQGNNVVTLGNGNDSLEMGNGNNTVTVGNGTDSVVAGNGNNVIVAGTGKDTIQAGNGNNLVVGGIGQKTIQAGNGSNILIDGSVQLTTSGDSLTQVLSDWTQFGAKEASSISSRLKVTYNTTHNNQIKAGTGFDWFWFTDSKDQVNHKPTDLLNGLVSKPSTRRA